MKNTLKKIANLAITSAILLIIILPNSTFAETETSYRVMGKISNSNTNAGTTNFNSHTSPTTIPVGYEDKYNQNADLSIIGAADGLAPKTTLYAATAVYDNNTGTPSSSTFKLEGYTWNNNIGFISFNCNSGTNTGVACGTYDYSTNISAADGNGDRTLSGYAWNQAFGWIYFAPAGGYTPVTLNSTGFITGHAWSEAGIWINFTNTQIELPGTIATTTYCSNIYNSSQHSVCIEVAPYENDTTQTVMTETPVANGKNEYRFKIYIKDTDGNNLQIHNDVNIELTFHWEHTLKSNQEVGQESNPSWSLDSDHANTTESNRGIFAKPVNIRDTHLAEENDYAIFDYTNFAIKSIAPTTNANTSIANETGQIIENDSFINNIKDENGLSLQDVEPNNLILKSIDYKIYDQTSPNALLGEGTTYVNGQANYAFKFKPEIEIPTLYSDNELDHMTGIRGIPSILSFNAKQNDTDSTMLYSIAPSLKLLLGFDTTSTESENGSCTVNEYQLQFDDETTSKTYNDSSTVTLTTLLAKPIDELTELIGRFAYIGSDEDAITPCTQAEGPSIYSKIEYTIDGGDHNGEATNQYNQFKTPVTVKYYNNKLPKTATEYINPAILVHGNVYAQAATEVNANAEVVIAGKLTTAEIRDTIKKNITKKLNTPQLTTTGKTVAANTTGGIKINNEINTEFVYYFNDSKGVRISDIPTEVTTDSPTTSMTVINTGGPVFIINDLYETSTKRKNTIVAFRNSDNQTCLSNKSGNIYITPNVKNIQASLASDCSIFSYDTTGDNGINSNGTPKWGSDGNNYGEMISKLENQLVIEGSLFSRNTIAGADLDRIGEKNYILLGTGEVIKTNEITSQADRLKAQIYDLNYLRLFRQKLEYDANGYPVDQSCGKALTFEDMVNISKGITVTGNNGDACNGIDASMVYNQTDKQGDLIEEPADEFRAKGHNGGFESEFDPAIVRYVQPTSFVFEKTKSLIVK